MLNTIREYGVRDERVLGAMAAIDRAMFVPEELRHLAYADRPLPIGYGQTISQPYTVARMCELLVQNSKIKNQKYGRVLEIGTGSGYQTAILARLFERVYSIELVPELAREAEFKINNLKFKNIKIKTGDGKNGWKEHAPYGGIIVAAMADEVPPALVEQLKTGGILVIPVRGEMGKVTKSSSNEVTEEKLGQFSFVPLV